MNSHYTYFLILAASLAGPLALSFDRKVAFYRNWKYLLPAMIIPALLYIAWDMYFTKTGVWRFNEAYITGTRLYNLPVEEVLFFFIVPYCCVFIYACVRSYFPRLANRHQADQALKLLGIALLITGLVFIGRDYTSWTFIITGTCIAILFACRKFFRGFDSASFLVAYAICLIPFLIVNGFLTSIPVVIYNDAENLGTRIYTIPFEDVFYGMLLIMMNIAIYERLKTKHSPSQ